MYSLSQLCLQLTACPPKGAGDFSLKTIKCIITKKASTEFSPQSTNPNLRAWVAMVMNEEEGVCQQSQMNQNIGIITIPKHCFLCSWLIKIQEYLAPSFSRWGIQGLPPRLKKCWLIKILPFFWVYTDKSDGVVTQSTERRAKKKIPKSSALRHLGSPT